jgi:ABC-type bacteriocin/lantibiotic exporter with double-glycine peptidase domain
MCVSPLALLCNHGLIKKIFIFADNDLTIFFGGILIFIIGVASVLSHNIWSVNWGLVITILGWVAIIKGIMLLFWPTMVRKINDKLRNKEWMPYLYLSVVFWFMQGLY